jgi:sugar (pentulose or hexulose) kinase
MGGFVDNIAQPLPTVLALDVGTQSSRAIVFDAHGQMLAKAQVAHTPPYSSPQPAWAEQPAERYWQALVQACSQLPADVRANISGLALTTFRASVVPCQADGQPVHPCILWLDQREASVLPPISLPWRLAIAAIGGSDLIQHLQKQAEVNWLAQHRADLRPDRLVMLSTWLNHRLTGHWRDSAASQVGYLPFDYQKQQWAASWDFKWQALAVKPSQLPTLVPVGDRLGALTSRAAADLGVPEGLAVFAAAADKACEVLGCGVIAPDVAQLSFGTTATINSCQDHYVEPVRLLPPYPAAMPKHFLTEIQIYRGFWLVSWFKREFAHAEQRLAEQRGVSVESLFDALIESVPAGSMGLTVQPFWSPGVRFPGPEAKGAMIGFGDVHTRAHVYRALIEGLIYSLRGGRDTLEKRLKRPFTQVVVGGGGSQSDAILQITADIFNLPVSRPEHYETGALGAAMNALVGLGIHPSYPEAVAKMCRTARVFQPQAKQVKLYQALYKEVYSGLYPRLQPLYQAIRRIVGYPA